MNLTIHILPLHMTILGLGKGYYYYTFFKRAMALNYQSCKISKYDSNLVVLKDHGHNKNLYKYYYYTWVFKSMASWTLNRKQTKKRTWFRVQVYYVVHLFLNSGIRIVESALIWQWFDANASILLPLLKRNISLFFMLIWSSWSFKRVMLGTFYVNVYLIVVYLCCCFLSPY